MRNKRYRKRENEPMQIQRGAKIEKEEDNWKEN